MCTFLCSVVLEEMCSWGRDWFPGGEDIPGVAARWKSTGDEDCGLVFLWFIRAGRILLRYKSVPNLSTSPIQYSTYEFSVVARLSSFASIAVTRVDKTSYESQWFNEAASGRRIQGTNLGKLCPITNCISHIIAHLGVVGFPSTYIIPTTVLWEALAVPTNGALPRALGLLPPVNVR